MLVGYDGADGVKTGYTGLAGRCLVTSVTKSDMRFISVVLFCDSKNLRTSSSRQILDYAYDHYGRVNLLKKGEILGSVKINRSKTRQEISAGVSENLKTVVYNGAKDTLYTRVSLPEDIMAPVKQGSILGTVSVFQGDRIIAETSLIAMGSAEKMALTDYISHVLSQWLHLTG